VASAAGSGSTTSTSPGQVAPTAIPTWIETASRQASAGMVAWGLALTLVGTFLSWVVYSLGTASFVVALEDTYAESFGVQGWSLIGGLVFVAGVVVLCIGATRLAAKADVVFRDRAAVAGQSDD
jgi:hypothetical protein